MKTYFFRALYTIAAVLMLVNMILSIRDSVNVSIDELPQGQKVYSVNSPDGLKTLNIYSVGNSLGNAVRGELYYGNETRNVYWQTGLDNVESMWLDDTSVSINGVVLNVVGGADYDCRRGYSIFLEGSIEGDDVEGAVKIIQ